MSISDLDIVCPYLERDKDRFLILWQSLQKFCQISNYRIFLVSKTGEKPVNSSKIISIKESNLDPQLGNPIFKNTGWWKQQIIKLLAHKFCETECILSLDCDCFLNKNLYLNDLIQNKKPKINIQAYGSWENWYNGSKIISQLPYNINKDKIIGVTPILLSRTILQSLSKYMDILYNDKVFFLLSHTNGNIFQSLSDTWTEYCLYHIYADYTGMVDRYHYQDSNFNLSGNSFWDENGANNWKPELSFNNPNHFFTVVQSTAKKSPSWIMARIQKYL